MGKLGLKMLKNIWKKNKIAKDERFIDFHMISLPNEKIYMYNNLYLIDLNLEDNTYYGVYISNINTSSPYSLSQCYMFDDSEEENTTIPLNDFLEMFCKYNDKKIIKELIIKSLSNAE